MMRMIQVWPFEYAPESLKLLSTHAGDEDWLVLVPPSLDVPPWIQTVEFGVEISQTPLANGATVCIGAHA